MMAKCLTLLLYIALVWCCFNNTSAYCLANETDRLALISFKGSIDQDPLGALSSWNDSLHYCDWKGITCGHRHRDRVIQLNLGSQGLVGSLSPHIGNLSFLRSIFLENNSFHGPIPQEIGRLFHLQTLYLNNNSFGGEIPKNLSSCSKLKALKLIVNHLTGSIPGELGSLAKLEALALSINDLSGTIPLSLTNLSSLSIFNLAYCNLHGEIPVEISRLQGLTFVQLAANNLSGKIPSGLLNISTINFLSVAFNKLHGSISSDTSPSILTLPNLQFVYLNFNQFTGTIPTSLLNASGLQEIFLAGNSFTGLMPKELGKLSRLQIICFALNQLQDDFSFISSITNCTSLQLIQLDQNLLRGVACSMESPRDRMQIQAVVSGIRKIKDVYENHALSQSHHIENIVKHEGEGIEG
ncbi:hypothetical protein Vadar_026193 [Vaccinium darrowii]|uniref:Uncharacterized protein n=1 Tax=Vaccinium darrowii TaxID=229202 RepID=A0ACB7Z7S4_9ERIC|nr:hypothetical protein Vadar_026193 [Vaccinium darrowii]